MRLLSFLHDNHKRFGALLSGERVLDLTNVYPTALAALDAGETGLKALRDAVQRAESGEALAGKIHPLETVTLRAPVPEARKVLALAGNYNEHIKEGGRPTYPKEETYPYFFLKPGSTCLIGHGAAVPFPGIARKFDYEAEFCIVIGKRGKHIPAHQAMDYVAGYTILNDVSERGLASKEPPKADRERDKFFDWLVGKWFDGAAPCGPYLVTKDEIEDPHKLRLRSRVNGELRQDSSTAEMIFSVSEIIAWISRVLTLEPGDLITTGTPAGVGMGKGVYLKPGDVVEIEIEGLGVLRNQFLPE